LKRGRRPAAVSAGDGCSSASKAANWTRQLQRSTRSYVVETVALRKNVACTGAPVTRPKLSAGMRLTRAMIQHRWHRDWIHLLSRDATVRLTSTRAWILGIV